MVRALLHTLTLLTLLLRLGVAAQAATLQVPADQPTIQAAINAAAAGDTIVVAAGTYRESLRWISKDLTIRGAGIGTSIIDPSVANGGPGGRCLLAQVLSTDSYIEGFTFQGGNTTDGGGIFNQFGNLTVTNCAFIGNAVSHYGGGMMNYQSSPTVTNCTFISNSAINGGGLYFYSGSPMVINCTFSGNAAAYSNNAAGYGGGMHNYQSNLTVTNCAFSGNSATISGGGMHNYQGDLTITNCTLSGNSALNSGGGMSNVESNPTLTNCILWGNSARPISGIANFNSNPIITYSDVQGLSNSAPDASGNFAADPLFVDAANGNLRLQANSPAINRGSSGLLPLDIADLDNDGDTTESLPLDRDGASRIADGLVDLGAYENQGTLIVTSQIQVTRGGLRRNNATGRYIQQVTLKNIGTQAITGPLSLVLDSLGGTGVTLFNKTGTTSAVLPAGSPYLNTAASLAPGASVTLTLEFTNPTNGPITYTPRVLAGPGTR